MFKFFRSSKSQPPTLESLVEQYRARSQIEGQLARAKSLDQLGRSSEAATVRMQALDQARRAAESGPNDKQAQFLLAVYLVEADEAEAAGRHLQSILARQAALRLTEEESVAIRGQLLALQRHQPAAQRPKGAPKSFTQVYCCIECGRLHNYLSLPCPECDWYPVNRREVAEGLLLSNAQLDVSALIQIGRRISAAESLTKIVGNLTETADVWLSDPKQSSVIDRVLEIAKRDAEANRRNLASLRQCQQCQERITFSGTDSCEHCGAKVDWPHMLRMLICIDSVLYWFEQRLEPSPQPEFSEFLCVLVYSRDLLLRKHEIVDNATRRHALELLQRLRAIQDIDQGAVISTDKLEDLQIYLVKDRMREDSKAFAQIIAAELQLLINHMKNGAVLRAGRDG